jgi:tRNA A-37 threonylcarbamoyl transferase component Bud32
MNRGRLWKASCVSTPRANAPLTLGGRYRVIERLGSGGMASVFLAEDERLGRLVAVKRLPTSSPEDALARFRREARLGASLNHPNVVSIFDSTTDDDALLIVMEYVEGESLKDRLRRGSLDPEHATAVLTQIAAALDHAHEAGVIHRDVKPSNVLIAADGTAKLADLGIATAVDATSITSTTDVIGTLSYIAPERLESANDDPSADVYSLAAVAFEALSGQRAQRGQTPSEIVDGRDPPDLREAWAGAPVGAAEVLSEGLARDPRRRPRSAGELLDRLSEGLAGEHPPPPDPEATATLPAQPPSAVAAADRPSAQAASARRGWSARRVAAAAALAAAVGALIAVIALGGGSDHGKRAARIKTQTRTVTTKPKAPQQVPLSGAALGAQLNAQGYSLIQQGRYADAIPLLQRAVNSFPDGSGDINYAYALFNLGHALRLAGQPQAAIPILEQRLQIPDQNGIVANELALARRDAGVAPAPTGGTEPPKDNGSSGGVKPPKGPKPGKGPEGGDGD